jgi:hypothetical protein
MILSTIGNLIDLVKHFGKLPRHERLPASELSATGVLRLALRVARKPSLPGYTKRASALR